MFRKPTTLVATSLMTTLLATALAAPGGAARAAQTGGGVQLADYAPHDLTVGSPCNVRGARLPRQSIRHHARLVGYRAIRSIRFVARRYGANGWCGYYRADAMLQGRPFVIYADSRTGRIVGRRELARYGAGYNQDLSDVQVRSILLNYGYRGIHDIRYVRRDGHDFFTARANWRGWVVQLWIEDETGRIVNRKRLHRFGSAGGARDLSQEEVRELLRSRGYRNIRSVQHEPTAYDVVAYLDDVPYRIRVSVSTGEIESEYRLR